jgi:hypothetical protein
VKKERQLFAPQTILGVKSMVARNAKTEILSKISLEGFASAC